MHKLTVELNVDSVDVFEEMGRDFAVKFDRHVVVSQLYRGEPSWVRIRRSSQKNM